MFCDPFFAHSQCCVLSHQSGLLLEQVSSRLEQQAACTPRDEKTSTLPAGGLPPGRACHFVASSTRAAIAACCCLLRTVQCIWLDQERAMRATTGASAARVAAPAAFCVRSQPHQVRQRASWTGRLQRGSGSGGSGSGGSGGGGGRRTSRQQRLWLAASDSAATGGTAEDLVRASYDLGAEERSWLGTLHTLLAAEATAREAGVSQLLQEFAALTPAQQWRAAWMLLGAAERQDLVHRRYAASSEAELVAKAAAEFEAQRDSGDVAPDLRVWLVLAAAHSRRSEEAVAAAGLQATAQAVADSSSSTSSGGGGSSAAGGKYTREQVMALLRAGAASVGSIALMWLGWQRAAAAGWALPPVSWGGGTVVSVLATCFVAELLTARFCAWLGSGGQRREGSSAPDTAHATVVQALHTTCVLVATAALLHALVLARHPQALSLGLFEASLWPLRAWLPAVVALGALQACLMFLSSQVEAAAR